MLPLVPCKRLNESEDEESDEIWEEVKDQTNAIASDAVEMQTIIIQRKQKSGISKKDRMHRSQLHEIHLICLLAAASIRNQWCNDIEIQGICLSLISKSISMNRLFKHSLKLFLIYWREIIHLDLEQSSHLDSLERIKNCLKSKALYSRNSFNIIFAAACRSMQLNVRLLACLSPISLSFAADNNTPLPLQIWLEVWDEFHNTWIPIDATKNIIDEPFKIIDSRQARKSWGDYVLAFDSSK